VSIHVIPKKAPWRRSLFIALLASLALAPVVRASTSLQIASSPDVKAAFLFNFIKFITWPAADLADGQPINVGIIGQNGVVDSLTALTTGTNIGGHAIVVHRLAATDDPAKLHMLFIGDSERGRITDLIQRVGKSSVVTVSDAARFCALGGIIQLRTEDDRVRFDINLPRAEASRLVINSKLLVLAGTVSPTRSH
jgi:hypothetical protein